MFAKNLQRFKLITFDVTDTLLRFKKPPGLHYAEAAAKFNCNSIDQQKIDQQFGIEFKKMTKQYPNFGHGTELDWWRWWQLVVEKTFVNSGHKYPKSTCSAIAAHLIDQFKTSECWTKEPRADELITSLKSVGKKVGVISNFDPRLSEILKNMELPEFDFVLTSYAIGRAKPDRGIFQHALDHCTSATVLPGEALHIGNTPKLDYHGAVQAGWCSLLVGSKQAAHDVKTEHKAESLSGLMNKLQTEEMRW
jgi:REG-2-like HAD superfamily hydrolase